MNRRRKNNKKIYVIITVFFAGIILSVLIYTKHDAAFMKGYLRTALEIGKALRDSTGNVFWHIHTFFHMLFLKIFHPEGRMKDFLTAWAEGLYNSIRYLFRGSDTSISTVLIKFLKIEKDGLVSLANGIMDSIVRLVHTIIDIVKDLFHLQVTE